MKPTFLIFASALALLLFFAALPTPQAPTPAGWPAQTGNSFLLRDVRLFDGEQLRPRTDLLIRDGRIAALGPRLSRPAGVPEYAAAGHTLLPGLIDSHTHSFGDAAAQALRFGVTSEIEMFGDHRRLAAARAQREALDPVSGADLWSAGTLVTARGGHGTQFGLAIPTLDSAADADAFVATRIDEGSDFIKLVLESGHAWGLEQATLDDATLAAAIAAAQARGRLAVVHVGTREEARRAVAAGADGLVHVFADALIDDALRDAMRAADVFVIPTLAVLESAAGGEAGLADDPRLQPWLDPAQAASLARRFPPAAERAAMLSIAQANTRALFEAGIAILAGSDAPNPGTAHGVSLHRELELLVEAGLPNAAALAAASSVPAARFALGERGRIAVGQRADLLLVAGDPLGEIGDSREIVAIWKNGHRVERPRQSGSDAAPATRIDGPEVGRFDTDASGWEATTDRIQGGQSEVRLQAGDGRLAVEADVRAGAPWPWAGAIRMLGAQPMAAVDLSAYSALELDFVSAEPLTLLLFSDAGGMPATLPLPAQPDGGRLRIEFAAAAGFDPRQARAVAVVAGPQPGARRFDLRAAVLR
jgi:imidazolonepropionase-like amidohydrolase